MQEAQLDKYPQELATPSATTNVTQAADNSGASKNGYPFGTNHAFLGRCRTNRGRQSYTPGNIPNCQLYNKYDHSVIEWWHRFDEFVDPTLTKAQAQGLATNSRVKYMCVCTSGNAHLWWIFNKYLWLIEY